MIVKAEDLEKTKGVVTLDNIGEVVLDRNGDASLTIANVQKSERVGTDASEFVNLRSKKKAGLI